MGLQERGTGAEATGGRRAVTVVVPIYDHWTSLEKCIASLVQHIDFSVDRVLLVNDCGPHVDTIEDLVLHMIEGHDGFEYHRNDVNLGFVGTCNRAALELDRTGNDVLLLNSDAEILAGTIDELVAVLSAAEHHGVVCPRSNNATIASIPFFRRPGPARELSAAQDREVFETVSPFLPRYYISPVAVGFCFLVRRSLIDNHGLFDTVYGLGYNEENDFCLRVNEIGYSSLIANHAYVRHLGSASFDGDVKRELDERNHRTLVGRYPFYGEAVRSFISFSYSAADVFAEVLASEAGGPKTVLIDIHHLSLVYNGSTRYALSFLRTLSSARIPPGMTITLAAQPGAISLFRLTDYPFDVVPYSEVSGVFDVGIALAPINNLDQLIQMNSHAARWLVSHFDMIASRSYALMLTDPLRPLVVEQALRYADRVIALSDFSLDDVAAFYPALSDTLRERGESVSLGSTRNAVVGSDDDQLATQELPPKLEGFVRSGGYVLVMGNFYPHKQVAKAVKALSELDLPIVAFGPLPGLVESDRVAITVGGTLSEAQLTQVFENAALMVFPSAYEGFGLPIADALDFGVPVVAFETKVGREVVESLGGVDAARFFSHFADLAATVRSALADRSLAQAACELRGHVRGLGPFNERLWEMALELSEVPLEMDALEDRFSAIQRLERLRDHQRAEVDALHTQVANERVRIQDILTSRTYRAGLRVARAVNPLVRVIRRSA